MTSYTFAVQDFIMVFLPNITNSYGHLEDHPRWTNKPRDWHGAVPVWEISLENHIINPGHVCISSQLKMMKNQTAKKIRHQNHSGMIHFILKNGTSSHFNFHGPEEASLLLDILRNEKPVYYDPEHEIVATGMEKVGEGE